MRRMAVMFLLVLGADARSAESGSAPPALPRLAMITSDAVRVRATPSVKGRYAGVLYLRMTATVLEASATEDTVEDISSRWYRIVAEDASGWVFGGFLTFDLPPGPVSTWDAPGDMAWFSEHFGGSTWEQRRKIAASELSITEYRNTLAAAEDGDEFAISLLARTLYPALKSSPDDPAWAYLRRRAWHPDFVVTLVEAGGESILEHLPGRWWRTVSLPGLFASGRPLPPVRFLKALCEHGGVATSALSATGWDELVRGAIADPVGPACALLGCGPLSALGELRGPYRGVRESLQSPLFIDAMVWAKQEWIVDRMPAGFWTASRLIEWCSRTDRIQPTAEHVMEHKLVLPVDFTDHAIRETTRLYLTRSVAGLATILKWSLYQPGPRWSRTNAADLVATARSTELVLKLLREEHLWVMDRLPPAWWTSDRAAAVLTDAAIPAEVAEAITRRVAGNLFLFTPEEAVRLAAAWEADAPAALIPWLRDVAYLYFTTKPDSKRYQTLKNALYRRPVIESLISRGQYWVVSRTEPAWLTLDRVLALLRTPGADAFDVFQRTRLKESWSRPMALALLSAVTPDRFDEAARLAREACPHDRTVMLAIVKVRPGLIRDADEWHDDSVIMREAITRDAPLFEVAGDGVRRNPAIARPAVEAHIRNLAFAPTLQNDRALGLAAVREDPRLLASLSDRLRNDEEVVAAAMQGCWCALTWASTRLQQQLDVETDEGGQLSQCGGGGCDTDSY